MTAERLQRALRLHQQAVRAAFLATAIATVGTALELLASWDSTQLPLLGGPVLLFAYSMALRRREGWSRSLGVAVGYGTPVGVGVMFFQLLSHGFPTTAVPLIQHLAVAPALAMCGVVAARRLGSPEVRELFDPRSTARGA